VKSMWTGLAVVTLLTITNLVCLADEVVIPSGKLGFRLGAYLTIEGAAPTNNIKVGNMVVDTVNGKRLKIPVTIHVENVGAIPKEGRVIIRGYESGKMIGLPHEVAEKENIPLPQAGWQFFRFFVATSVVAPKDLKINQ